MHNDTDNHAATTTTKHRAVLLWAAAAAAVLVVAVLGLQRADAQQGERPGAVTAAWVDVERVLSGLDEFKHRGNQVEQKKQELQADFDAKRARGTEIKDELETVARGSDVYFALLQEAAALEGELKFLEQKANAELEVMEAQAWADLLAKAQDAAGRVAQQRGYDYVVVNNANVAIPFQQGKGPALQAIAGRRMLYASAAHDVSNDIVGLLNAEWNK